MALATLNECYNNINVFFNEPVKITRHISGKILMDVKDNGLKSILYYIKYYLKELEHKMAHKDKLFESFNLIAESSFKEIY
jgi:hypothetical protein